MFTNNLPSDFGRTCPFHPLIIHTNASKGLGRVRVSHFAISLPKTFSVGKNNVLRGLTSDLAHSKAVNLSVVARGLGFLATLAKRTPGNAVMVPSDVGLGTHIRLGKPRCGTGLRLGRKRNSVKIGTRLGASARTCTTSLGVSGLRLRGFLPGSSVCRLSLSTSTGNHKLSIVSCHTLTGLGLSLSRLRCTHCRLSGIRLAKTLGNTLIATGLADSGTLLGVAASTRCGLTRHCPSKGIAISIARLSLRRLKLVPRPVGHPLTFGLSTRTHRGEIFARLASNSVGLGLDTHSNIGSLVDRSARFVSILVGRVSRGTLGRTRLHRTLPATVLSFSTKGRGPLTCFLTAGGVSCRSISVGFNATPS